MSHTEDTLNNKENFDNEPTIETSDLQEEKVETTVEGSDIEVANAQIEELNTQVKELREKVLRQQAEFDNFRKRTLKEKSDIILTASRDTMSALLPVVDDFDRAAKNGALNDGTTLIYNKLVQTLSSKGLKPMDSPSGCEFNPDEHEAITEITAGDALVGKVVETVEKGYFLNEKLIRHAKVVVGR